MNSSQLLIGIPFCNEYDNLIRLIKDLELWHPKFKYDLVFVNDGSTDNSENLVSQKNYKTITSKENKGYGHSVKLICSYANELGYQDFIIFPGDYQRTFSDLERLVNTISDEDLIICSKLRNKDIPIQRKLGNLAFSLLISLYFYERPMDVLSGFKAYKTKAFNDWLNILPDRYEFDLCLIYVTLHKKLKIKSIRAAANYENQSSKMTHTPLVMGLILLRSFLSFIKYYKSNRDKFNKS